MKYLLCLLLTSCAAPSLVTDDTITLSPAKQRQRIAYLQKKLELAEREQTKAQEETEALQTELARAQLALIRRQVEGFENQLRSWQADPQKYYKILQIEPSVLFLKERETLHALIQSGPSPASSEAQVTLDRILRMITELGDHETR